MNRFLIFTSLASSLLMPPAFAEQSYAEKGVELVNKKNYSQALEPLRRAIEQDPSDSISVYNRGQAYRNLGKNKEAIADYTRYLEMAPDDAENYLVYHNRGVCYNAAGDYNNAIADFDQVLAQQSSYQNSYLERAEAYLNRAQDGDYDRALSDANSYIAMAASVPAGYVLRGRILSASGKSSESIKDFDKALTIDKACNTYAERGRAFHNDRQYDKAIQDYDKVLIEMPNDGNTWYNRGLSNKGREQWKAAVEDFTKSLSLIPNDAWALLERGRSKVFIPDYRGAIDDISKSLDVNPDNCDARYERAEINLKLKLPDAALQDLNTAISKGKAVPQWYALRALAQARLGDFNKANSDLQSSDSLFQMLSDDEKPAYLDSQAYAGLTEVLLGKSADAFQRLDKAIVIGGTQIHNISKAMLLSARGLANARLNKASQASADSGNAKSLSGEWGDLASFLGSGSINTASSSSGGGSTSSSVNGDGTNRPVRDKWALVVGISDFKDGSIPKLKYSAKDARDFREFLIKKANFSPDHIRLLVNQDATRMRIMTELGDKFLPRVVQPDDLVVLYFSSHGSPSSADFRDKNYFIAYDSEKTNLFASGIELQELMKVIKGRVDTNRVIVILDACHSGGADANAKSTEAVANFDASELIGDGQLVICSSESSERSYESKRYQNGVFTKALMDGLTANGANTKLKEAFDILKDKVNTEVKEDDGQRQTPVLKSQWNGDDVSLALPATKPRQLPIAVKQLLAPDSATPKK
ncbi:tetratricopeptide repeat protein [bacterium]|nr:tetratricopeptide repeat protein [bacterium]QQR56257.1 MAG: tetratricopeptide repeat protein [Candidatus Melainabacteria bacterium]